MNITEPGQWPAGIEVTVNIRFEVPTSVSAPSADASSICLFPNDIIVGSVQNATRSVQALNKYIEKIIDTYVQFLGFPIS